MQREDFIFTIGYQGDAAIVDKRAKKQYGRLSTTELAEKGLYKSAFCSALFSNDSAEMESFLQHYRTVSGNPAVTADNLKRAFGVFEVPESVAKLIQV